VSERRQAPAWAWIIEEKVCTIIKGQFIHWEYNWSSVRMAKHHGVARHAYRQSFLTDSRYFRINKDYVFFNANISDSCCGSGWLSIWRALFSHSFRSSQLHAGLRPEYAATSSLLNLRVCSNVRSPENLPVFAAVLY
jgi:hypothetical protein